MKKKRKELTPEQKRAISRNRTKMALMGFRGYIGRNMFFGDFPPYLLDEEGEVIVSIKRSIDNLIANWDKGTEDLLGIMLPPYKCAWCGKRSNVPHIAEDGKHYCLKHNME